MTVTIVSPRSSSKKRTLSRSVSFVSFGIPHIYAYGPPPANLPTVTEERFHILAWGPPAAH